jgi:hypothetical protein
MGADEALHLEGSLLGRSGESFSGGCSCDVDERAEANRVVEVTDATGENR